MMVLTNFPLTFNDKINLFVFVLAHIPTKHPASTSACCWVSTVDRAAPHVPHPICINLWEERQEARKKQLYYNDLGPWLWREMCWRLLVIWSRVQMCCLLTFHSPKLHITLWMKLYFDHVSWLWLNSSIAQTLQRNVKESPKVLH